MNTFLPKSVAFKYSEMNNPMFHKKYIIELKFGFKNQETAALLPNYTV